jgi:acetyl/propionyl-CoA carboxylase alpha subunit
MSDKSYTPASGETYQVLRKAGVLSVESSGQKTDVALNARSHSIDAQTQRVIVSKPDGSQQIFWIYAKGNKRILSWLGGTMEIDCADLAEGAGASAGSIKPLKLTMPGKVLSVKVKEGEIVEIGQGLVIVEAMKMENLLVASARAKVTKVHVKEGDRLDSGAVLITFSEA